MPTDFRREEQGRGFNRRRDDSPRQQRGRDHRGGSSLSRSGHGHAPPMPPRRTSRSRSPMPMLQLHHQRNKAEAREQRERDRGFYDSYHQESQQRQSRERERRSPPVKSRIIPGPPVRHLRMDDPPPQISRSRLRMGSKDKERRHDDRNASLGSKRNANSNSVFANLDRVVKRAREDKDPSYWNKKVMEVKERDPNKWGHSGFRELYPNEKRGNREKERPDVSRRSRSRSSPPRKPPREEIKKRSRSPRRNLIPMRSRTPPPSHPRDPIRLKSFPAPKRKSPPARGGKSTGSAVQSRSSGQSKDVRSTATDSHYKRRDGLPPPKKNEPASRPASEIGNRKHLEKSSGGASGGVPTTKKSSTKSAQQKPTSRPSSGKESKQPDIRQKEMSKNSSISGDSSRTPSPQLKKKAEVKEQQRRTPVSAKSRSSSSASASSSDEDVLEIHARDRRQSLSNSSSDEDSISDESVRKPRSPSFSSSPSDSSDEGSAADMSRGRQAKTTKAAEKDSRQKKGTKSSGNSKPPEKSTSKDPPKKGSPPLTISAKAKDKEASESGGASESESESSSESEEEPKMTLSERFAKLTQMSRDKREFAKSEISMNDIDTKLKVVKDLRNADTKVFVNSAIKRPISAKSRPKSPDFNEGEGRYPADDRRRHFERMTRDEPLDRDRPTDWSDVRVRFNYYKSRGYFDERPLTLEEYSKWEAWWYEYRDWLAEEGYYDQQTPPPPEFRRGGAGNGNGRGDWRPRDDPSPPLNGPRNFGGERRRNFQGPRPQPEPLLARPIRFDGIRYEEALMEPLPPPARVPISRRIGHGTGGSLVVNIRPRIQHQGQGNFRGGRGRLAGRIGYRR